MKTCRLNVWGATRPAYAERIARTDGTTALIVRAWDDVAGAYLPAHEITEGQRRYVVGRTLPAAVQA